MVFTSENKSYIQTLKSEYHRLKPGKDSLLLINYQLLQHGYPQVIIRYKDKRQYYQSLANFQKNHQAKPFKKFLRLQSQEALHKRLAYLKGNPIVTLAEYARQQQVALSGPLNKARRQSIPAFRERGVWKVGNF